MARKSVGGLVVRGGVYYYRRREAGKVIQRVLRDELGKSITDKKKALKALTAAQWEQAEIVSIKSKESMILKIAENRGILNRCTIKVTELERSFFSHPAKKEISESSERKYREHIKRFVEYVKANHPDAATLSDITPEIAQNYMDQYQKTGISNRTFNYCLLCLSVAFRQLLKEDSPFKGIAKKRVETEERQAFSIEQLASIWRVLQSDYHLLNKDQMITLYIIALNTGLRCGDCCNVRWEQIDLEKRVIEIVPAKTKASSRKRVIIPINEALYSRLASLPGERVGHVIPAIADRYKRNNSGIYQDTTRLITAAGITPNTAPETVRKNRVSRYSFHSFRHTFASLLIEAGTSQTAVSRLLGHSTLTMTNRYIHISDSKRIEAVNSLPTIGEGIASNRPVIVCNSVSNESISPDKEKALLSYLQTIISQDQMMIVKAIIS